MNPLHTLITAGALVVAVSAHAQDCSGGKDGGMDATGNECNQPARIVDAAQPPAKFVSKRSTTFAARRTNNSIRTVNKSDRLAGVTTPQSR